MPFRKPIDAIEKPDIDAIVEAGMPERQTLDYKQALPAAWTDRDKGELLADLCSFARILYGVRAKRHAESRSTGIEPRIPGLRIRATDAFPEGAESLLDEQPSPSRSGSSSAYSI